MLSPQLEVALQRALLTALPAALLAALGVYATSDDIKPMVIAFLTTFLTVMTGRGLAEGVYDQRRQTQGAVHDSDVQPLPPTSMGATVTTMPPPSARG